MNHCRDCKHFNPKHWFETIGEARPGWAVCGLAGTSYDKPDAPSSLAIAVDYEGYASCLTVSPDFGCVQWEPVT